MKTRYGNEWEDEEEENDKDEQIQLKKIDPDDWVNPAGVSMESNFKTYLHVLQYRDEQIKGYEWLSIKHKTDFDFVITLKDNSLVYVDVVSYKLNSKGNIQLYTSHKDYKKKLRSIKGYVGYLAFRVGNKWRFIRIDNLPAGDVTLTSNRRKHVKTPSFVLKLDYSNENNPNNDKVDYRNTGLAKQIIHQTSLESCLKVW